MVPKIPQKYFESLTVRELEDLLEAKKRHQGLAELLRERDRLRLELRRIEDSIEAIERMEQQRREEEESRQQLEGPGLGEGPARGFLAGKKKRNLKDYIAQVLLEAGEPLSPSDIQKRLPAVGYVSHSTNPRSFYNTVFQALQRYDIFSKDNKKYRLSDEALGSDGVREILPRRKTRLKDYIVEVLSKAQAPLKVSEIASRVVIAGYTTDLSMEELTQRVSATLKKYLNKDFDWDSQRYRLANRN